MSFVAQQNVINAVASYINTSIGSLVGNRITENKVKQNQTLPLAVYDLITDDPEYVMNKNFLNADFQVNIFGSSDLGSAALRVISDKLVNDFDTVAIDITGYDNEVIFVTNKGTLVKKDEEDIYQIIILFNIKGF